MKSSRTETRKPAVQRVELARFTRRESQILDLLFLGKKSREIGAALHISEGTVNFWIGRIENRLDIHNRTDLVRRINHTPWLLRRSEALPHSEPKL